jgi:hypothetical protein
MKTIIRNDTNVSIHLFNDDAVVSIANDKTTVGNPVTMYILDCTSANTTLHENVTPPSDWKGQKYLFNGTDWTANPNYAELTPPQEQ